MSAGHNCYKGNWCVTDLLFTFEVVFVAPVKAMVFSCHIILCHTSFPLCADWIRMTVPLQLLPTDVVCSSWDCLEHVPFLELDRFLMWTAPILYQIALQYVHTLIQTFIKELFSNMEKQGQPIYFTFFLIISIW